MSYRIFWNAQERNDFFESVLNAQHFLSWSKLAEALKVHPRTLADWRRGKYRPTKRALDTIASRLRIPVPTNISLIDEQTLKQRAGTLGAVAYQQKYGNPGTAGGRRRGGQVSWERHSKNQRSRLKTTKQIVRPRHSTQLAEFVGIILGDGNISPRQVHVFGCESTDSEYKNHVKNLGKRLFGVGSGTYYSKYSDCWTITFSSTELVKFLQGLGLPKGNKILHGLCFPDWVKKRRMWLKAAIRGLFDTDGCIYSDHHRINGKDYWNLGLAFTSGSQEFRQDIVHQLKFLGYSPTLSRPRNVLLRRRTEIDRFFTNIQPNNQKHIYRYREFVRH